MKAEFRAQADRLSSSLGAADDMFRQVFSVAAEVTIDPDEKPTDGTYSNVLPGPRLRFVPREGLRYVDATVLCGVRSVTEVALPERAKALLAVPRLWDACKQAEASVSSDIDRGLQGLLELMNRIEGR